MCGLYIGCIGTHVHGCQVIVHGCQVIVNGCQVAFLQSDVIMLCHISEYS